MEEYKKKYLPPVQKVLISFLSMIFAGTFLLLMPVSTTKDIGLVDALFTSTSAVCVTGLIVLDTAKDFTLFGRIVILLLIQFGGLGIMTFSLGLLSFFGRDLSIKWRFAFADIFSGSNRFPIMSLLMHTIRYTLVIELITAIALFTQFYKDFPLGKAIEHSVFHAVSAFCNAGFSTFSNNLMGYSGNAAVISAISAAIILGGIGFIVLYDLANIKFTRKRFLKINLSMHSKLVLVITSILIVSGMLCFLFLESRFALKHINTGKSILISFFQSVTCRTAGFNTIDIGSLRESTQFMMIFLMLIGGSPGSVAGGIKTTTIGVVILLLFSRFKGDKNVNLWRRSVSAETVERSLTLLVLAIMFISFFSFLMLIVKDFDMGHSFHSMLFETVSAFCTVGLSMGITSDLPALDKIILCFVMFIGRLGPLTIIMALTSRRKKTLYEYPEEHIMIG